MFSLRPFVFSPLCVFAPLCFCLFYSQSRASQDRTRNYLFGISSRSQRMSIMLQLPVIAVPHHTTPTSSPPALCTFILCNLSVSIPCKNFITSRYRVHHTLSARRPIKHSTLLQSDPSTLLLLYPNSFQLVFLSSFQVAAPRALVYYSHRLLNLSRKQPNQYSPNSIFPRKNRRMHSKVVSE